MRRKRKRVYDPMDVDVEPRFKKRRTSATQKANKALRLIRNMQKREEMKAIDTTINLQVPIAGNAAVVTHLNSIIQGDSASQRIGNKITFKTLSGKLIIKGGNGEVDGFSGRVLIVYDRDTDGAACAWNNVCDSVNCLDLYNITNNKGRFQVLYDKIFNINSTGGLNRAFKFFINLKNKTGDYSLGNDGGVDDIAKGSIYLMVNTVNNTVAVDLDGYCRLRFTD